MAIEFATIDINAGEGITVQQQLSYHNDPVSNRLLVIFPGRNYYVQHPVLHYLRKAALIEGWDVLPVQFGYQVRPEAVKGVGDLESECKQNMTRALERGYGHVCIAGKSMGSPLAVQMAQTFEIKNKSLILLTPIGSSVQDAGDMPTLAVIGTADPVYDEHVVNGDTRPNVTWRVYHHLNHGLEIDGDYNGSIEALKAITTDCVGFLRGLAQ